MLLISLSNVGVVDLEVCCPIFGIFHFAPRYFNIIDRSKLSVGRVPNCCFLKRYCFFSRFFWFSFSCFFLFFNCCFLKTPLVFTLVFFTAFLFNLQRSLSFYIWGQFLLQFFCLIYCLFLLQQFIFLRVFFPIFSAFER